jgi:crossover junction endodeoxyribonuclease RusA
MELTFVAPTRPLSVNEKVHWAAARRRLAPWRSLTRQAFLLAGSPSLPPSTVTVTVPFSRNARRDPHNYVAPLVKALIDELVQAGAWPDDDPTWVTVIEPVLVVDPAGLVVITITPR